MKGCFTRREDMDSLEKGLESNGDWPLKYTRALSFPRKTGTEGEKKAAQSIVRILEGLGYETAEEEFSILIPPWVWMKGNPLLSSLLLLILWLAHGKIPFLAFLLSTLYLLSLFVWDRVWLRIGEWMVSADPSQGRIRTENIVARFPGDRKEKPLYLMAHYDSKSQSFNLYLRTGLFLLAGGSGGLFSLCVWIQAFRGWMGAQGYSIPLFFHLSFFLSLAIHLVLIFSESGNRSEGAVDNASGVGALLAIARVLAFQNRKGVDLRFVFTGAEEIGLLGSLMFKKRWGEKMVEEGARLINIDSVGKRGKMRVCGSGQAGKKWLKQALSLAREKGMSLQPLRFHKGILMDHLPFCQLQVPSLSLTSVSTEGWHLHTPRDRFSLVHSEGLAEMEGFVLALVDSMATNSPGLKRP